MKLPVLVLTLGIVASIALVVGVYKATPPAIFAGKTQVEEAAPPHTVSEGLLRLAQESACNPRVQVCET